MDKICIQLWQSQLEWDVLNAYNYNTVTVNTKYPVTRISMASIEKSMIIQKKMRTLKAITS